MRTGNLLIITVLSVGFFSSASTAQVVINMPPPTTKAIPVKAKVQPSSTDSPSSNSASSTPAPAKLREGDVALRRYVRSRRGPQYTSGLYNNRRYGYGYGYYGYYSPFFFGFGGGFHHHHNHNSLMRSTK